MYFIHIGILEVTGIAIMIYIMVLVVKSEDGTTQSGSAASKRRRLLDKLLRPFLYIVMFFFVFLLIFIYRAFYQAKETQVQDSVTNWVQCKIAQEVSATDRHTCLCAGQCVI